MNDQDLLRYSRQIFLPEIDVQGQERILQSRVAILGLGGLGSPAALYLTAAGVGEVCLLDDDAVEWSNLQRQIIHSTENIGQSKVDSAAVKLKAMNPQTNIRCIKDRLTERELEELLVGYDVLLDCSDNFSTRFACNRVAHKLRMPLISGAAIQWRGQVIALDFRHHLTPCYRCLFDEQGEDNNTCSENGVIAPLVGVIGSMQAMEAIKVIVSNESIRTQHGVLHDFDALQGEWKQRLIMTDPNCFVCSV